MPERKGRRRRARERRSAGATATTPTPTDDGDGAAQAGPPQRAAAHAAPPPLPSPTARATGFLLAVFTAFLAALMIRDALGADRSGVEATLRATIGVLLVLLSIAVAMLCLAPGWVRSTFFARRSR
jgi:hypothetical protein